MKPKQTRTRNLDQNQKVEKRRKINLLSHTKTWSWLDCGSMSVDAIYWVWWLTVGPTWMIKFWLSCSFFFTEGTGKVITMGISSYLQFRLVLIEGGWSIRSEFRYGFFFGVPPVSRSLEWLDFVSLLPNNRLSNYMLVNRACLHVVQRMVGQIPRNNVLVITCFS